MSGSQQPRIIRYPSLNRLVGRLRDDFVSGGHDFVLLYAYNGPVTLYNLGSVQASIPLSR